MIYHVTWGQTNPDNKPQTRLTQWYGGYFGGMSLEDLEVFRGLTRNGQTVHLYPDEDGLSEFAKKLKDPTKNDTYLFVLVQRQNQIEKFDRFIEKYDLKDCVTFRSPLVTNPVHTTNGRQLQLVVMQSINHFQKELSK
jgi:hypothetical protein